MCSRARTFAMCHVSFRHVFLRYRYCLRLFTLVRDSVSYVNEHASYGHIFHLVLYIASNFVLKIVEPDFFVCTINAKFIDC